MQIVKSIPQNPTADILRAVHPDIADRRERWGMLYHAERGFRSMAAKQAALPKAKTEEQDNYQSRLRLSKWTGFARKALDRMLSAVFEGEPTRKGVDPLAEFLANADGRGGTLSTVTRRAVDVGAWYGACFAIVDSPELDPLTPEPVSQAEAAALGLAPYVALRSPLALADFQLAPTGQLTFAKFIEVQRDLGPDGKAIERTRVDFITPERTAVFFIEPNGEVTAGPDVDREPAFMPVTYIPSPREDCLPFGLCLVDDALDADLQRFQLNSDRMYDLHQTAHPHFLIWTREKLSEIGLGVNTYLKLDPGDKEREREDAKFAPLDVAGITELAAAAKDARDDSLLLSGVNPLGQTTSNPKAASGVSIAYSFETTEKRLLSDLAGAAEHFETNLLRIVAAHLKTTAAPDVVYSRQFSMRDPSFFANQLATVARYGLGGELWRAVSEQYAAALAGDAAPERVKKIRAEIGETDGSQVFGQKMTPPDLG